MKDPMNRIERFCYKHPHFGIPNLMRYVAIANIAFWLFGSINPVLASYLTFSPYAILHGQIWRLVTFMLGPPQWGILAFVAIYFYYWIGSTLEQYWGTPQFTIYYLSGAVLTAVYGFICYFIRGSFNMDVNYIYLSMFFSFAVLFPDMEVLLFFIIPVKMKYLAIIDAVFFVIGIIGMPFPENLLPLVAVGNFLIFCGGDLMRMMKPRRVSRNTVNFRREVRKHEKEQKQKLYTHKCEVCGRTDADYPDLEFRYCSRCAGYHCFCEDHINNHIHFTE